jgi:phage gpG-like protein
MIVQFKTQWQGLDTMAEEEFEDLRPNVEAAIMAATLYYEGKVKQKLRNIPARTGRVYTKRGRRHQASAPGEPPALEEGKLRQSITHTPVRWEGDNASAEVGTSMPQGRILELGGVGGNGSRILPRPYFSSTWLEEEEKIQSILDRAVRKAPLLGDIVAEVAE